MRTATGADPTTAGPSSVPLSYVLPIRLDGHRAADEMTPYLEWVASCTDLIIVDGSTAEQFRVNDQAWTGLGRHVVPAAARRGLNGKAWGVLTGLDHARGEHVIVADDDVRYDEPSLRRMQALLYRADLVIPQNYFDPVPWHAAWDTARTLINRGVGSDFPGTLGIRSSILERSGGYDSDVLFENLELIRTVQALGGSVVDAPDLYIRRLPPTPGRFWNQRLRQAYDDLGMPIRLLCFLTVLPAVGVAMRRRAWASLAVAAPMLMGLAEFGRRRHHGRQIFPARASLFAPIWVLERGIFCWAAVWQRLMEGGCRYNENILKNAATPLRVLHHRFSQAPAVESCAAPVAASRGPRA